MCSARLNTTFSYDGANLKRQHARTRKHPEYRGEARIFATLIVSAKSLIERRLNRPYVQFICLLVLAVYLVALLVSFATSVRGRTVFGPYLGADFGAFYIAGKIFNTQSPDRIYDAELHQQLYLKEFPDAPPDNHLPYVNAPFFILPFTLFSRLPYSWAYLFWVGLSFAFFVAGFTLIWRTLDGIPADAWLVSLLLGISFMPFLVECLAGGQTSAIGFFCLAVAISSERRRRQIVSGLALSLCTYKPTLILLILPMLVGTRRYATLLGFAAGCGLLALISWLAVGWQGCAGFINTLLYFTSASTSAASGFRSWKYVDVNSFFRLLLSHHSNLRWILTAASFLFGLPFLLRIWWQGDLQKRDEQDVVWALTICGTLVLNIYVGIYDSTLLVLSVLLTTDVLYRRADNTQSSLPTSYKFILLLLYVVPWITQPVARLTGLQLLTLVLALLGSYQILQFQQVVSESKQTSQLPDAGSSSSC